ncbi:hypothetical protein JL720_353 [Aureococcus anophagefferens]|nr:hypothetical protein JL720_353 [Aureococcus anophagefferens]
MQQAMLRHETSAPVVRQTRRASMANVVQDLQSLKTDATDEKVAAAKEDLASYAESLRRGLANAEAPADRDELRSELTALQRAVVELKEVDKDAARGRDASRSSDLKKDRARTGGLAPVSEDLGHVSEDLKAYVDDLRSAIKSDPTADVDEMRAELFARALQNHVASIPVAAEESKDDGLAMIGAELQSLRAELVAPPARAHRRSSFAALKADLVELKKRGGVDEDALAYVKQDIATYVRELREEAKPDAFDGDNANAMREELRILQKELADVRDAQARRPASPRPRPADESALEKLSDQLSSLQATIAAPPRAIEERRRTYATITSDLEQLKRNRGEPDDRLKSRIAKYVREINEERPREGLDFDDANVAEMREELKHLTEKLKEVEAARDRSPPRTGRSSKSSKSSKSSRRDDVLSSLGDQLASLRQDLAAPAVSRQHRRTSYANMKQDLAVLKDRAAAGRELSGDALATVKHDLAACVAASVSL